MNEIALAWRGVWSPSEITTLDDWTASGRDIIRRAESATWDLADWAAMAPKFGQKPKDGEEKDDWHTLKEFCEAHNLNYGAVKTYAWVARQIPRSRRIDLSFGHHQTVAPLPDDQQDKWLEKAKSDGLSVSDLRAMIRDSLGEKSAKISGPPALEIPTEYALNLHHWLGERPDGFWQIQSNRDFWKPVLKPFADLYEMISR